ncbi:MAG: hypothetical protein JW751_20415 [Polyangiaceae bacterium]|nr:hypothetical protein [Polyangiaceae bacterium]
MTNDATPENARVVVLIAHPDDETLWAGGTLLMHPGWTTFVGCLCRASDGDRAPRFVQALACLGAQGGMADLDDGPAPQAPLDTRELHTTLLSLLPGGQIDILVTHELFGEYARHLRHEEVSRSVLEMWASGGIVSRELWLFAYADAEGTQLPEAEPGADVLVELSEDVWRRKRSRLANTYGLSARSWEARAASRREAFWRLTSPSDARSLMATRVLSQ